MSEEKLESFAEQGDRELIALIAEGNEKAFNELVGRHMRTLYALSYRMSFDRETAEDVLQETFLRVWRKAHTWNNDAGAAVGTWLYKIAYNVCIDIKRKQRDFYTDNLDEYPSAEASQDDIVQKSEVSIEVEKALQELPGTQYEAIVLCHYQGLSNVEAAQIMDKSVKAIESLLVRGRKALKRSLANKKYLLE